MSEISIFRSAVDSDLDVARLLGRVFLEPESGDGVSCADERDRGPDEDPAIHGNGKLCDEYRGDLASEWDGRGIGGDWNDRGLRTVYGTDGGTESRDGYDNGDLAGRHDQVRLGSGDDFGSIGYDGAISTSGFGGNGDHFVGD